MKTMFRAAGLVAAITLGLAGGACGAGDRGPRPDERRRSGAGPSRIVSLVPAVTETLFALGAGDRVVGVSSFDRYPPEVTALPAVGGLLDPDLERIAALRPDLVVVYATQDDLRAQVERMGIDAYAYRHGGLAEVLTTIRQLGARLAWSSEADMLARQLEDRLGAVRREAEGRPRPRTLLVFGREPGSLRGILASGGRGFLADLLEIAGGANVFGHIPRESLPATTEAVLAAAPEVVIELLPDSSGTTLAREARAFWLSVPALPAVAAGRVHVLVGDQYVVPGPRLADATEALADALHDGPRRDLESRSGR